MTWVLPSLAHSINKTKDSLLLITVYVYFTKNDHFWYEKGMIYNLSWKWFDFQSLKHEVKTGSSAHNLFWLLHYYWFIAKFSLNLSFI